VAAGLFDRGFVRGPAERRGFPNRGDRQLDVIRVGQHLGRFLDKDHNANRGWQRVHVGQARVERWPVLAEVVRKLQRRRHLIEQSPDVAHLAPADSSHG
jgi:hypothetical protein